MDELDIHNRKHKLELVINNIKHDKKITNKNKELLFNLEKDIKSLGLSVDRVLFYLNRMRIIARWLNKDFDKANKEDIKRIVLIIESNDNYSAWTKFDYKRALRIFYKWLYNIPWRENKFPNIVNWINVKISKRNHKLPSELLNKEDIKKLISATNNIRDKALIMTLYEGGLRIGELLNMKIKDVEFNNYGVKIKVNGKTGERVLLLISSTSLLASWLECHPFREDKNAYLWLGINASNYHKQLKYSAIRSNLIKIAKRAGLNKRVNPHIFRHSRATELAKHLTEAQMCKYFGWEVGSSKMPGVYVHLSMKDIEDAILKIHGKKQFKEFNELTDKICPRCKQVNSSISKYCSTCGLLLDEEQAINMVQVGKDLIPLSAVKEMIKAEFERMKKEFTKI